MSLFKRLFGACDCCARINALETMVTALYAESVVTKESVASMAAAIATDNVLKQQR